MNTEEKKKKGIRKYFSIKYIFLYLIFISTLIIGVGIGFFGHLVKGQKVLTANDMEVEFNNISKNSEVYFANATKASTINSELIRKVIPLSSMGDNIKKAIIASEDATFYSNNGIDLSATLRATYSELSGNSVSGGSTLTQQLVKNQLLDNSRSYERKAKEILLATKTNKYFTKDEILEKYLNMAPFGKNKLGQNINGIETAALGVFGLNAKDLNVAQAAYLAGFVQSPFRYTPFDSSGNLRSDEVINDGLNRQKYVLDRMLAENYITKDEYNIALSFDIKSSFLTEMKNEYIEYPYISSDVTNEATRIFAEDIAIKENSVTKFNNDAEYKASVMERAKIKFLTGGYKVTTTIDKDLYDTLEKAKNSYTGFTTQAGKQMEIGASIIENSTGKILAFIGGRSFDDQQLNHASQTYRSPGSTIKPILVFGPAMDKGYITPKSNVLDKRFNYYGWKPENFSKTEKGMMAAEDALAMSLNLPTIRLYSAFYEENPMKDYLIKMNFDGLTEDDQQNLAASIGGLSGGITVNQNTAAFAAFANGGIYKRAHIIEEIRDSNDNVIYTHSDPGTRVYSEDTSYMMVKMLNKVLSSSGNAEDIARALKFDKSNVFAKTGTSEYAHDLWTIGGTTNITLGLWTGFDQPQTVNGVFHAHTQWAYFMNAIYDHDPNLVAASKEFTQPSTIRHMSINPMNNAPGSRSDIVPTSFVQLDNAKMQRKFGSNLDRSAINISPIEQTTTRNTTNNIVATTHTERLVTTTRPTVVITSSAPSTTTRSATAVTAVTSVTTATSRAPQVTFPASTNRQQISQPTAPPRSSTAPTQQVRTTSR
ncbi:MULTISPECIES: transglycosylase domain-containing protein [unclassified Gemella]|uniref:transglycosylase domain-containing protein n=1 Tax=unclassified Gemella TaxID=2624949 RepID=UPI0010749984|nr:MULTISPECIES: transglycosylase domain-containing protein [unclassified Gemella]MBF0709809.1 penicillin-binding protein [Gemella sp. GL1.1]MBF0747103.1 penicillin-binding protein [Gemella sp. 19428wG2_WT2a]NYS27153.1 penicillin-binding protein [Gemella sp. GL1]TFU58346.1 penicillin-binding protein [Gemella sp. WT2a]